MVDLAVVGRLLVRRWWLVALVTALVVALAGAYVVVAPKTWRASTRVLLDPRDKQLVGADVNKPQYSVEAGWTETRAELVKSHGVLAAVVEREHLTDDAEVVGSGADGLGPDALAARAVRNLAEMVLVERPKENNLIDVTVTSKSPEKSARLSRAVAQAFVAGLAQAKVDQIEQANALLSRQVETMRQKMMAAEAKVEDYKRANGITVTRGNLVDEETLRQLNESLVSARQKAQEAKERWEKLKQVMKTGEVQFPAGLDGVGSSVLSRLKIEAALAAKRRTEIEQDYGPLHPKARAAAAEMDRDRSLMTEQVKSLAATAEMDYQLARAAEDNVRKNLDRAQARLADTGQATVALQELENEAQARRELYKSFVSRMEETNLQKSTQISDATVVSPAQVPLKPFAPRIPIILGLALLAGLGAGVSVALLAGRKDVRELLAERERERAAAAPVEPSPVAPVTAVHAAPLHDEAVAVAHPIEIEPVPHEPGHDQAEPASFTAAEPAAPIAEAVPVTSTPPREPQRVDLALTPERIARLGGAEPEAGAPIDVFVETADGRPDVAGLAALRRLVAELGGADARVRLLFSDTVPTPVVAALAHGFARAEAERGARVVVVDLADDASAFDEAFDRANPVARSRRRRVESGFDLRADAAGVVFARPEDAEAEVPPGRRAARLGDFLARSLADHDRVVVHLGASPPAAALFDAAEVADHVTMVVDEKDLSGRRFTGEVDVMRRLLPRFDALLSLRVAGDPAARDDDRRRRARA